MRALAVLFALALVAASCGDDDDTAGDDAAAADGGDATATDGADTAGDDAGDAAADDAAADDAAADDAAADDTADDAAADDAGADPDGAAPPAGAADDSLPPVRIGLLNQENDPVGSFPEMRIGIEAAADYINAEEGGIGGHPIEIVSCIQSSIEMAQECAQELATDDLVSVINGINIWTFAFDFYGTMGETPVIGGLPLFPTDYNAPNARYFNGGSVSVYAAMARFAAEELGAQKVALLVNDNPAATSAVELGLRPIFEQFGVEYTTITVPLPLVDAVPPVTQAADEGADYVMLLASGNECIPVARAADQMGIAPEQMIYSGTCAAEDVFADVGDLMVGSWIHKGGYTKDDPWAPAVVQDLLATFESQLETYAPEAPDAPFTGLGWATMLDLGDLYREVGFENLADPANIFAVTDDGTVRGREGSFGWSCVWGDIGLASVCQGDNLFVTIAAADGTTNPPPNDGAFVNGLELLGG